jgi:hypothetical protein
MRIRYAGTARHLDGREHRDYPHRLELLDLSAELSQSGFPTVRQVGYGSRNSPELRLRFHKLPSEGENLSLEPGVVKLSWVEMRHKSLNAKLIFVGLEEGLLKRGYEVESCLRALGGRNSTPLAMMVKFEETPTQRQWSNADVQQGTTQDLHGFHFAEEVPSDGSYIEGSVQSILVNRYERDPRARGDCIGHYGTKCFLCNFDFVEKYGDLMEGFIHVHHLKLLSTVGADYQVDPVRDLRPVCPNCHAVLHRREPPYSLEDISRFLQK